MCLDFIKGQWDIFSGFKQRHIIIKLIGEQINLTMKAKNNGAKWDD